MVSKCCGPCGLQRRTTDSLAHAFGIIGTFGDFFPVAQDEETEFVSREEDSERFLKKMKVSGREFDEDVDGLWIGGL